MVATVLALLASPLLAQQPVGVVKRAGGSVVIDRGALQVVPKAGTEILRGDRVITGPDGHVSVSLYTAGSLSVGPDTAFEPERYVPDQRPVKKPAPALLQGLASFLAVNRQR